MNPKLALKKKDLRIKPVSQRKYYSPLKRMVDLFCLAK
jgi:hypothetical protein